MKLVGCMAVLKALMRYFDRVGVDKNFIHVDNDPDKPRDVAFYQHGGKY